MSRKERGIRPELIGELNGIVQRILKDLPENVLAHFRQGAAMNGFRVGSQATSPGITKNAPA